MSKMNEDDRARFEEIAVEIKELADEAFELVRGTEHEDRAKAYWYAQIRMAVDDDHTWLGSGSCTMQEVVDAVD